jgi:ion channel POLLUX/CASTOR
MREVRTADRLRYRFDTFMSRGTTALIGALGAVSLAIVLAAGIIVTLGGRMLGPGGEEALPFHEAAWAALMRAMDAGTLGGDAGWGFRGVMFLVTLGGIFVISTLIGVLTSGVQAKMDELRKGRSRIIEHGHTVILGWSTQIFEVVSELTFANANQHDVCIAVLADRDKVDMEDELRQRVPHLGPTRIVCRTGNPMDLADLEIVSPHDARAIVILAPETDDADTRTIKTMLALTNNPNRRPEPYHIVAEVRNPESMEAARLVGRDEAELVLVDDLISRVTAQTCRQSGLSVVYTELMDFGGDEIYFTRQPSLTGRTFGDALGVFETSSLIGARYADGRTVLNPRMDSVIADGDQLIVIAQDDDTTTLSTTPAPAIDRRLLREPATRPATPERTLILGWNRRGPAIVRELDQYVAAGSHVTVVAPTDEVAVWLADAGRALKNQTWAVETGDTTSRRVLDALDVPGFNHVITLGADKMGDQESDARTLVTLLHLRDIADRSGRSISIVSEMLDVRNRALAEVTKADDFIVSDKLVSLMMSQLAENKHLAAVFQDLFDPEGSEVYLKPASDYVATGTPLPFYAVLESARQRGEVAFGYRRRAEASHAHAAYGIVVNPKKSDLITFAEDDRVIVLAEN